MRGHRLLLLVVVLLTMLMRTAAQADRFQQVDAEGNVTQRGGNNTSGSSNFNKHNNDTTRNKEIPKGYHVWTIDRKFGSVLPAEPDTLPHLYMNTTFNQGITGDYNTTGSNYTPRLSRIFFDRQSIPDMFIFTQPYSYVNQQPDDFLFMNTLSPFTNVYYDNCGDKQFGEDRVGAKFSVNANKRTNVGFDLNYAYARGYYSNQPVSHFNGTLFGSYLGDRYNMHVFFNAAHQKVSENGGITDDEYVVHPEAFQDDYTENEIPTVLSNNWNRNDHQHLFLTHRYNLGFYRKVPMTEEELKARKFAEQAKQEQRDRDAEKEAGDDNPSTRRGKKETVASGRPDGARIMGAAPKAITDSIDSLALATDTTRIKIESEATIDSLNRAQAIQDSIDATMKSEYVPVTSFFHTLEWNNYDRVYQSYQTPSGYYLNRYYDRGTAYGNDSIYDQTRYRQLLNTFGVELLEGFNKYVKAGLKLFVTHEYNTFHMPDTLGSTTYLDKWTEHNISVGGALSKTQGKTLHFDLFAEAWLAGADAGQLQVDFHTDLNFPFLGDTVQLAANAYFYRTNPVFFQQNYHSKHIWWDYSDMSAETRTRIEGIFSYPKTNTRLRVGVEEIQNYTYYGMSYDYTTTGRKNMTAGVYQEAANINLLTAQLSQNFRLGPLHWDNIITYQSSSNSEVLPLPTWNVFSNLYLKFKIAKVLGVELGADAVWFSKYYAPDFCPAINQFAVQQNQESRVELGGYPFVDVYANMVLKGVRFFVMMSHVNSGSGNRMSFLTPHYPMNNSVLHLGVSWNFYN